MDNLIERVNGEANLRCHSCARACEYYLFKEVQNGDTIYVVAEGEVIICGHCGRRHREGMEMQIVDRKQGI